MNIQLMKKVIQNRRHDFAVYIEKLKGLSPITKLNSGFSYVTDEKGRNIRSVEQVQENSELVIRVTDGQIQARVVGIVAEESL